MPHPDRSAHPDPELPDRSPAVAELLDDAYIAPVDVETASRHLWAIHREAARLADAAEPVGEPAEAAAGDRVLVGAGGGGFRRRVPRAAVPLLVILMVMSSSGMALAASRSSLPGDVLYPIKRGSEHVQLILARDPEARAQMQLAFARTRLEEIRRIAVTRPQHVPALMAAINVTLSEAASTAPEDSERVRAEVGAEIAALELPPDIAPPVDVAGTQAPLPPTAAPTTTATPASTPTATPTPTEDVVAAATPPEAVTPTATPAPSPVPTTSRPPEDVATADVPVPQSAPDSPSDPTPPPTPPAVVPRPTASPTPTPTPTPTPSATPTEGTSSRSDDGDDEAPDPAPTATEPAPTTPPTDPVQPYTRPSPEG